MHTLQPLPRSRAQWLSLMQHVGVPTRLLDWTESAAAALYFAVSPIYFAVSPSDQTNAAVWLLNPIELNKLSGITNLPASDSEPVKYSYGLAFGDPQHKDTPTFPIAVAPTQVHIRMAVQLGRFTIHGTRQHSFVQIFQNTAFVNEGNLAKIVIPSSHRPLLRSELDLIGVRHAALFPDLDGLAKELRVTFTRYED